MSKFDHVRDSYGSWLLWLEAFDEFLWSAIAANLGGSKSKCFAMPLCCNSNFFFSTIFWLILWDSVFGTLAASRHSQVSHLFWIDGLKIGSIFRCFAGSTAPVENCKRPRRLPFLYSLLLGSFFWLPWFWHKRQVYLLATTILVTHKPKCVRFSPLQNGRNLFKSLSWCPPSSRTPLIKRWIGNTQYRGGFRKCLGKVAEENNYIYIYIKQIISFRGGEMRWIFIELFLGYVGDIEVRACLPNCSTNHQQIHAVHSMS